MKISKTYRLDEYTIQTLQHIQELEPTLNNTKAIEEAVRVMNWILSLKKEYKLNPEEAAKTFESWYTYWYWIK